MKTKLTQDIISDANLVVTRIKVDGGFVVNSYDKGHGILGSCFVPDHRTQLAGQLLAGIVHDVVPDHLDFKFCAQAAVAAADALIAELNGEPAIEARPCARCKTTGKISYNFIDWVTCEFCNGTGQILKAVE